MDDEVGVLPGLDDVLGAIVPNDVGLARLHAGKAGGVVGQRANDDLVEIGPVLVPIIGIALEHDAVAGLPRL